MSKSKEEINDNRFLFDIDNGFTPTKRFESCLIWYIKKACFYKTLYHVLAIISAVLPILAAALHNVDLKTVNFVINLGVIKFSGECIEWGKWGFTILSIIASVSTIIMTTFRVQDKWTKYRSAAEELKRMGSLYLSGKTKLTNRDREFLISLEEYMKQENLEWMKSNKTEDDKSSKKEGE